jgi:hypothetical protein
LISEAKTASVMPAIAVPPLNGRITLNDVIFPSWFHAIMLIPST